MGGWQHLVDHVRAFSSPVDGGRYLNYLEVWVLVDVWVVVRVVVLLLLLGPGGHVQDYPTVYKL